MPTFTRAKLFTSVLAVILLPTLAFAEWNVDFSRRFQKTKSQDLREPASQELPVEVPQSTPSFVDSVFQTSDVDQEIVVLNTEKGFVPGTVRVKKGLNYQIHVVNVNDKEKNVSFVLDSFSEHHATFYGKIKTFMIRPQKEGVFRFVSPETAAQGKLVVYPGSEAVRLPASK